MGRPAAHNLTPREKKFLTKFIQTSAADIYDPDSIPVLPNNPVFLKGTVMALVDRLPPRVRHEIVMCLRSAAVYEQCAASDPEVAEFAIEPNSEDIGWILQKRPMRRQKAPKGSRLPRVRNDHSDVTLEWQRSVVLWVLEKWQYPKAARNNVLRKEWLKEYTIKIMHLIVSIPCICEYDLRYANLTKWRGIVKEWVNQWSNENFKGKRSAGRPVIENEGELVFAILASVHKVNSAESMRKMYSHRIRSRPPKSHFPPAGHSYFPPASLKFTEDESDTVLSIPWSLPNTGSSLP